MKSVFFLIFTSIILLFEFIRKRHKFKLNTKILGKLCGIKKKRFETYDSYDKRIETSLKIIDTSLSKIWDNPEEDKACEMLNKE